MANGLFYPLSIVQGETIDLPFSVSDDTEEFLFDDHTIVGQYRSVDSLTTDGSFTFEEDDSDPDIMHALVSDTSSLSSSSYVYEIRATNNDDNKNTTLLYGSLSVSPTLISESDIIADTGEVDPNHSGFVVLE